jgi:uncharacterized membrane protein
LIILSVSGVVEEHGMFIISVGLLVCFVLVVKSQTRIHKLEYRLDLIERATRRGATASVAEMPMAEPTPAVQAVAAYRGPVDVPVIAAEPEALPAPAAIQPTLRPEPSAKPKRNWTFNFEDLFGRRLPIWAGGITLAIAGVLIAKYAIDAGLMKIFTPWVRVIGGLLFGVGLIAGAEWALRKEASVDDPRIRQALSGAGIATLYATILVAANVYTLISPVAAFVGFAAVTAGALALSIRFGVASAVLGLAGGLAAPAMVGGMQPNVPLLAVYLALTIAGLAGVSRMQRWAWLGIIALAGGAGWSLWMIAASSAFDVMATLSVGGYVLLLAVALPMLVIDGPRAALFRSASAVIGAAQLALMVALGGFSMLNWGLFALLAVAGQWLAWRDKGLALVATISLGLSVMLLVIWPSPQPWEFSLVGGALALVHALPLLALLWKTPALVQRAVELCVLTLAALIVAMVHFYQPDRDTLFAFVAMGAGAIPAVGLASGWAREDRLGDACFALLTGTLATLLVSAFCFAAPIWLWPIGMAGIAAALLFFAAQAHDMRIDRVAAGFAVATLLMLILSGPGLYDETARLVGIAPNPVDVRSVLRWAVVAAMGVVFAVRARAGIVRAVAQAAAMLVGYGAVAQFMPVTLLPLVAAIALAGLAEASRRHVWPRLAAAIGTATALTAGWAIVPVGIWAGEASASLGGIQMSFEDITLTPVMIVKQVLVPATALVFALWRIRGQLPAVILRAAGGFAALLAIIAIHSLFRMGFALLIGSDFIRVGMAQRLVWEAMLIGGGWLVWRSPAVPARQWIAPALAAAGTLHALWYTLLLHNPLWALQAVGAWPLVNLLAPAFGLVLGGMFVLRKMLPDLATKKVRSLQLLVMALVSGFAWATLRQLFHGTLLFDPGVFDAEDILRSILAIALAVGFLLWGIRTQQRDWRIASLVLLIGAVGKVFLFDASGLEGLMRIASFVALGFSLIGIGWLYSRQLGRDAAAQGVADVRA